MAQRQQVAQSDVFAYGRTKPAEVFQASAAMDEKSELIITR